MSSLAILGIVVMRAVSTWRLQLGANLVGLAQSPCCALALYLGAAHPAARVTARRHPA